MPLLRFSIAFAGTRKSSPRARVGGVHVAVRRDRHVVDEPARAGREAPDQAAAGQRVDEDPVGQAAGHDQPVARGVDPVREQAPVLAGREEDLRASRAPSVPRKTVPSVVEVTKNWSVPGRTVTPSGKTCVTREDVLLGQGARRGSRDERAEQGQEQGASHGASLSGGAQRPPLSSVRMDERALTERLVTYDTSTLEGMQSAAGFVKGWLEARDVEVTGEMHNGRPVLAATVGPAGVPTVVFHGHLDVVPASPELFEPRVDGDRLYGRGAYDMKGGLAAMMCALHDVAAQDGVRVHFLCVSDEESEEADEQRGSTHLVAQGYIGDFAITGEPTDLHIGVQAKGVLVLRIEVDGHLGARLHPLDRRQRGGQGDRRVPPDRVAAVRARVVRPLRPAVDQPRPHRRRRRHQPRAGLVRDRRGHPLPARARTPTRSSPTINAPGRAPRPRRPSTATR